MDPFQTLLGMMAGGKSATDTRSALLETLAGQEGVDPTMQALLTQAMSNRDDDSREGPIDDGDDDDDDLRIDRRRRALQRLRQQFYEMQSEIAALRQQNRGLRAALRAARQHQPSEPAAPHTIAIGGTP